MPWQTVAGAFRLAGSLKGKTLAVTGAGMLGLVACAMGAAQEAEVIAIDLDPNRLETALQFGASQALQPSQVAERAIKVDVVMEMSGAASSMEQSLQWLHIGGTAVWVGGTYPQRRLQIDSEAIIRNYR